MCAYPFGNETPQQSLSLPFLKAWILFMVTTWFLRFGATMILSTIAVNILEPDQLKQFLETYYAWIVGAVVYLPLSYICFRWSIMKFIFPEVGIREGEFR